MIFYEGWIEDWQILFDEINDKLNDKSKNQLIAEIIFLTHKQQLHEVNMGLASKSGRSIMATGTTGSEVQPDRR